MARCAQCGKEVDIAYKARRGICWCSRNCWINWSDEHHETRTCELCRHKYKARHPQQKYCFICQRVLRLTGGASQQRQWMEEMVEIANDEKTGPMRVGNRGYERVTVDIDDPDNLDESRQVLRWLGFRDLDISVSSSGEGYHIIAWVQDGVWRGEKYIPKYQLLFTRRIALDDAWRVYLDSLPHRQLNVLFDGKKKRVVKDGEETIYNNGYE